MEGWPLARLSGPYWDDIPKMVTNPSTDQWSFRKTGTMGTLASQAGIDVWVQAPGAFAGAWALGVSPPENFSDCNPEHFGQKMVRNRVLLIRVR